MCTCVRTLEQLLFNGYAMKLQQHFTAISSMSLTGSCTVYLESFADGESTHPRHVATQGRLFISPEVKPPASDNGAFPLAVLLASVNDVARRPQPRLRPQQRTQQKCGRESETQ